jgi:hypothetical protein
MLDIYERDAGRRKQGAVHYTKKNQKLTEWLIFLTHSSTLVLNTGIIVGSTLAAPYQSVNYSTK